MTRGQVTTHYSLLPAYARISLSQIDIYRGIDACDFSGLGSGGDANGSAAPSPSLPEYAWTHEISARVDLAELHPGEHPAILPQFDTLHDDMTGFDVITLSHEDTFDFIA